MPEDSGSRYKSPANTFLVIAKKTIRGGVKLTPLSPPRVNRVKKDFIKILSKFLCQFSSTFFIEKLAVGPGRNP